MMDMELMVRPAASASAGPTASAPKSGYAPTYYPGTPNVAEAQRITLAAGQESSERRLRARRRCGWQASRASSSAPTASRSRARMVSAVPANREFGGLLGTEHGAQRPRTAASRSTACRRATTRCRRGRSRCITSTQGDNVMVFRATAMAGGGDSESGSTPLASPAKTCRASSLTTSKGGTATGALAFDGPRPASLTSIRADVDGGRQRRPDRSAAAPPSAKEDGTFELKGLTGPRLIRVGNAPPGWTLKSVKLNGTDITDTGAEFKAGETTSGLESRADQQGHGRQWRRHGERRRAPQGLHGRHLLGDARSTGACR